MSDQGLQSAVSRLEAVASRLEALATRGPGQASGASDEVAPFVLAFDQIVNGNLAKFLSLSNSIGGDVKTQVDWVKEIFHSQREYLVTASKSKQPTTDVNAELLKPMSSKIDQIQTFREQNRRSEFFNHLSTLSESIAALGWVTVAPAPSPFVKEMLDAGTFYSNRVLKDYKEKDKTHVEWTRTWTMVLKDLQAYVKEYHTTGLTWNPQGSDAKASSSAVPPPPAGGAPPPPPPPGPPPPSADLFNSDGDDGKSALFASINKGETVTKGLRKVTDDMKTHKNPALRQGPAPFKPNPSHKPATAPKPGAPKPGASKPAAAPAKTPVLELQDEKKWIVEYHKDNKNIVIDGEIKHTVYVYKCEGSVIQIKGKINSVVLDSCKKSAVVFDDVLSSVEFVNCQSVQGQVKGTVNTLSIDKTDGCQFYLSKDSLNVEIVSAKSSEMNIVVPVEGGDFKEFALPEQYKTMYDGKKMVTTVTESI